MAKWYETKRIVEYPNPSLNATNILDPSVPKVLEKKVDVYIDLERVISISPHVNILTGQVTTSQCDMHTLQSSYYLDESYSSLKSEVPDEALCCV